MTRPETKYAHSGDVMIAYEVSGEGNPIDLVLAPGTVSHLDMDRGASRDERLSSFSRLIKFDKRGTGLSDRGIYAATLEERTDDIRAVMDAAQNERAFVFGFSGVAAWRVSSLPRTPSGPEVSCCGAPCLAGYRLTTSPGEPTRGSQRVQGIAVHIGARVAALAGPSDVVVSSTVKDLTVGSGLVYEDAGEHELKGVPDRWRLYRVVGS